MKTKKQTTAPITYDLIRKRAKAMEKDTVRFLSDLVRTQSFSSKEKNVIAVIKKEMQKIGFDGIRIDGLGNIIGRIGKGKRVIAFDGHVDTVYPGDLSQWNFDPFKPFVKAGKIWGRGAVDQKGRRRHDDSRGPDHQGTRPERSVHDLFHRHGHGGRLRRPLLAIPAQCREVETRTRRHHRTDEHEHLSRPSRSHGDPRRGEGQELSWFCAGTRRQRDLQNCPHRA